MLVFIVVVRRGRSVDSSRTSLGAVLGTVVERVLWPGTDPAVRVLARAAVWIVAGASTIGVCVGAAVTAVEAYVALATAARTAIVAAVWVFLVMAIVIVVVHVHRGILLIVRGH